MALQAGSVKGSWDWEGYTALALQGVREAHLALAFEGGSSAV